MKIFERITTGLSVTILAVCCVALLMFGISMTGWKALSVPTGSMRPAIPPGSLVLVHRVSISSLKVGDVITYINPLNPKTTLSHRIVKEYLVNNKIPAFVTKGDSNKTTDVPVTEGSVVGKVVWHIPNVGNWLMEIKQPIVILPIIYVAALIIMAEEVIRLKDYLKSVQPYHDPSRSKINNYSNGLRKRFATVTSLFVALIILTAVNVPSVLALLGSNTVSLVNNRITVASLPISQCSNTNNTTIDINNSSSQTGSSGNVTNSGNTIGGSATSGSVNNSNSTSININTTGC